MARLEQIEEKIDQASSDLTAEQTKKLKNSLTEIKNNEKNISDRSLEAYALEIEERIEAYSAENKKEN